MAPKGRRPPKRSPRSRDVEFVDPVSDDDLPDGTPRSAAYTVNYDDVLDDPPPGSMNPLVRHPVAAETIRGQQVQRLKEAIKTGGKSLQSVADHLAFVARQADPTKPGNDFVNLAPYTEALRQLPADQRRLLLEAAGNPPAFADVLAAELPSVPAEPASWADMLVGEPDASADWAEQIAGPTPDEQPPVTLADVEAPADPSSAVAGQYRDATERPPAFRYSTWAGSDVRRNNMRLEDRAQADRNPDINTNPMVYDQMAELNEVLRGGKVPVLPPVRRASKPDMLTGANAQTYRAMVEELQRISDMPVDPQRFDAENDFLSVRMGPLAPPPSESIMDRVPTVFRTQADKDAAVSRMLGEMAEVERRMGAIPEDLAARKAAIPPIETQVLKVGTGAVGGKRPLWSENKPLPLDIEAERRMRAAAPKSMMTLDQAASLAEDDPSVTWDLDKYYPRWRARLSEVDASGNVTPASRPPSGLVLAGLIADAAGIADPYWPESVAPVLESSIKAQASLPPSTPEAMRFAQMTLTPAKGGEGIKYLTELAKNNNYPFPFFTDLNVPMWTPGAADPSAASWADAMMADAPAQASGGSWADMMDAGTPEDAGEAAADVAFASSVAGQPSPMAGYPAAPPGTPGGPIGVGSSMDPQSVPQRASPWPSGLMNQSAMTGAAGVQSNRAGRLHKPMTKSEYAEAIDRYMRAVRSKNYMDPSVPRASAPGSPPVTPDFSKPPQQRTTGPLDELLLPPQGDENAPPVWLAPELQPPQPVAPPTPTPGGNWADDLFSGMEYTSPDFLAFDTMNRRRDYNPLAALIA